MGSEMCIRDSIKIWMPDYSFDKQLEVKAMSENSVGTSVKINRKALGKNSPIIEMGLDMKLTVLCEFTFLDYPMDLQICYFPFQNKRYLNNMYWIHKIHQDISNREPFRALGSDIVIYAVEQNSMLEEKTGLKIHMRRVLTPFVLQCYAPAVAIVLISSIGFIVPLSAIPGRITLGVTLFLTMANIFYDNRVNSDINFRR